MNQQFLDIINKYDVITIWRHEHPDCDAFGSQFGMKQWLNDNYPNKKVYACGSEASKDDFFPSLDKVDEQTIKSSLAIVLDTSGHERIDGSDYANARFVLKIDHHPNLEPFGDAQIVLPVYAATCEILTDIFTRIGSDTISHKTAEYLYRGLLTDTLCFRTTNTTANTLLMASELCKKDLNIPLINQELFDKSLNDFKVANYIRTHIDLIDGALAIVNLNDDDLKKMNITGDKAREFVAEIGQVKEFMIWAIFTERIEEGGNVYYDGSLRSKKAAVNTIANKYGGGGHKNAAGIKNLTKNDRDNIINDLKDALLTD